MVLITIAQNLDIEFELILMLSHTKKDLLEHTPMYILNKYYIFSSS